MEEKSDLVERLSEWAQRTGRRRFWAVAATTSGLICALMPTVDSELRVALFAVDEKVMAQVSHPGWESSMLVGAIDEDPEEFLGSTVVWLREQARVALRPEATRFRLASASAFLASELGDVDAETEARSIVDQMQV